MGAVDLVIQVESPKSVARGLQRIGRAGHELGAVVEGPHLPEVPRRPARVRGRREARCARARSRRRAIPRNPLDVLAQQIVAICADGGDRGRRAAPARSRRRTRSPSSRASSSRTCSTCSPGRYPSDEFAELRPRIVWDRTAGVIRGRTGRAPARGHERRHDPRPRPLRRLPASDGGGRVGELDEEMVYEARAGQTFLLGASTWRIEEITRDRVLVSPAPGVPGAVPFWKGEGVGRPVRARARRSARSRASWRALPTRARCERLRERVRPRRAAPRENLLAYLREQAAQRPASCPTDRTIVVERFRDEIGDWRVCVLTPFGGRVHAPWAMALAARLRDALGARGAVALVRRRDRVHLPDADAPPPLADLHRRARRGRGPGRAASSARRRCSARASARTPARALLIPRAGPGQRTPLWQQRLKAQSLLEVARDVRLASRSSSRPTASACRTSSTCRRCASCCAACSTRELDLVEVETPTASPFASLAALRLRRHLHVRGRHARRRAPRRGAVARPRPAARAARPGGAARADRPGRARGGRGAQLAAARPARTPTSCTTCSGASATCARGELELPDSRETLVARAPRGPRRIGGEERS